MFGPYPAQGRAGLLERTDTGHWNLAEDKLQDYADGWYGWDIKTNCDASSSEAFER
jgi:hypothetical protein